MSVFFLIVAVESVILVVSARQFERAALQRLTSDAQLLIEPLLVRARATGIQAPDFDPVLGRYGLRAVAVYARDGRRVAFAGEGPLSESPPNVRNTMATPGEWLEPDHLLTASWRSELDDASTVAVLIDASQVARDLRGYELRILGLVAVIILVVTAGIMATMDFLLLRPMLHLRASTLRAAKEPETAAREAIPTTRSDEMGELITAHNAMLRQIADGKRRDRELAEERARFVTHHDALTGLPNRLALLEFLDGQRGVSGATLFLVNVLQFRVLNATLGPDRGNRLLCRIAARLKTNAAPGDFVAHPGADRFAVVVPGESSAEQASSAAERMLEALVKPFDLGDGVATTLKSCVGIAQRPAEALEGRLLISEAELALTRTYGEEDVTYQFFSDRFAEEAKVRHALTQDLERAIARDELYLVYQPKVTLNSGAVSGAEALIRWYHPRRGLVSPIEFIPIAETTGLITPIGDLVLRAACTQVRDWLERHGWSPAIAVNLSARQFTDHDLCGRLGSILGDAGIPA
ncbi:MAG: EAL domain-containing protein, partial [Burkholderiales bacterium]